MVALKGPTDAVPTVPLVGMRQISGIHFLWTTSSLHRSFRLRLLLGRSLSDYFDRSDAIPRNILDHVLDFFWSRMAHEDVKPQG